jgi:DnaJ-class molecular chaperone
MICLSLCCYLFLILCFLSSLLPANNAETLYSILGIKKSADIKQIKRAYRDKAKATHPDKQPPGTDPEETTNAFRKVVEAYETLSDAASRRRYDQSGETINSKNNHQQQHEDAHRRAQQQNQQRWGFGFGFGQQQQKYRHRFMYVPYIFEMLQLCVN